MKNSIMFLLLFAMFSACEKGDKLNSEFYDCKFDFIDTSYKHPSKAAYQALLTDMTSKGVVGVSMSVYHPQSGIWLGSQGKADLKNQINMQPCQMSRMGSIVKMYTATVIMQLAEAGKIKLDDKISNYLSGDKINKIRNAETASIRQLLQHSSGIYNYIQNLKFQTASLNSLLKTWYADDLLAYAYNQKPYFKPGEDVRYSNTNYILLGLLIEAVEGRPLYQVFDEKIIVPLALKSTQFAGKNPVPNGIVRGYIDIYSNLQVVESTYYSGWDYYTADGGLISNTYDMNVFFRALMHGQLIKTSSLNEMLVWKTPKTIDMEFFPIHYGLGIFKIETAKGIAYMHSGDAIGYSASMLYFPSDSTTLVYAVNSNYGKIDQYVSSKQAIEKIINVVK